MLLTFSWSFPRKRNELEYDILGDQSRNNLLNHDEWGMCCQETAIKWPMIRRLFRRKSVLLMEKKSSPSKMYLSHFIPKIIITTRMAHSPFYFMAQMKPSIASRKDAAMLSSSSALRLMEPLPSDGRINIPSDCFSIRNIHPTSCGMKHYFKSKYCPAPNG